ncbi:hypothetical protein [Streptomyces cavernicola]|uniref:Yip1 domain-containing protein n=1 Tax=Streptomyces cavernicola TaxID=3043613 RepID=A0ABT6S2T5_9ACTN|nr:hypothetical protein [Streptomyces sp. B-S-A6]MDI3402358.1 hypothetical protein [Streptomyces sp. B-S-A6]
MKSRTASGTGDAAPTLIAPPRPAPPPPPRLPPITRAGRALRRGCTTVLQAGDWLLGLRGRPLTGAVLLAACGQMALMALLTREVPEVAASYPDLRIPGLWLLLTTFVLLLGHLLLGVTTVVLARALGGRGGLHRTPAVLAVLAPLSSLPLLLGGFVAPPESTVVQVLQFGGLAVLAGQLTRHIKHTQDMLWGRAFLSVTLALLGEWQLAHAAVVQAGVHAGML